MFINFYSEFEDKTIEEESITFSISATNFRITGLLRGLRIVPFATWQKILQRHTSQKNRHHLLIFNTSSRRVRAGLFIMSKKNPASVLRKRGFGLRFSILRFSTSHLHIFSALHY